MIKQDNCIFCKIVSDSLPANIIYRDDSFIAFLDIRPLSPGHTLVIPKDHHRWVWDVPNTEEYFAVVKKIALALRKAFNTEIVWSKIMGDEIEHAHIWVMPHPDTKGDKNDFAGNAEKIRRAL